MDGCLRIIVRGISYFIEVLDEGICVYSGDYKVV